MRTAAAAAALLFAVGYGAAGMAQAEPEPPAPPPTPKTTIDADGTYAVGTDITPGTYSSAGPNGDSACYWKRVNGDAIVDNALTKKPQVVQIEPTDTAFTTNDCQPWQLTDGAAPAERSPLAVLGDLGSFIVPRQGATAPEGNP